MTKEQFIKLMQENIGYALEELSKGNTLDLRVNRTPYHAIRDYTICSIDDIESAWEFIKDAEEWYVDIYENMVSEGRAEFADYAVASWGDYDLG